MGSDGAQARVLEPADSNDENSYHDLYEEAEGTDEEKDQDAIYQYWIDRMPDPANIIEPPVWAHLAGDVFENPTNHPGDTNFKFIDGVFAIEESKLRTPSKQSFTKINVEHAYKSK